MKAKQALTAIATHFEENLGRLKEDFAKLPIDELDETTQERLEPVLRGLVADKLKDLIKLLSEGLEELGEIQKIPDVPSLGQEATVSAPQRKQPRKVIGRGRRGEKKSDGELTQAGKSYLQHLLTGERTPVEAFRASMISMGKTPATKYSTVTAHLGRVVRTILDRYTSDPNPLLNLLPEEIRSEITTKGDLEKLLREGRVSSKVGNGTAGTSFPQTNGSLEASRPAPTTVVDSVPVSKKVEAWNHLLEEHVRVLRVALLTDPPIGDTWEIFQRGGASAPGAVGPLLKVAIPSLLVVLETDLEELLTPIERKFREELQEVYEDPLTEVKDRLDAAGIKIDQSDESS